MVFQDRVFAFHVDSLPSLIIFVSGTGISLVAKDVANHLVGPNAHFPLFRNVLHNRELFYNLPEAKVLIEQWRKEYNTIRPHSALKYRPPAPEAVQTLPLAQPLLPEPVPTTT